MTTAPVFKDLEGLVKSLKGELFSKWMRRAQKQALTEWRDREQAPGLAARFTKAGEQFYNFSKRLFRRKLPAYVHTGALRDMMKRRTPKALNNRGTDVVTVFKYGGGALNFLGTIQGVKSISVTRVPITVNMPAVNRKASTVRRYTVPGGTVTHEHSVRAHSVRAYSFTRQATKKTVITASKSYAAEFAEFTRDQAWISKRVGVIFSMIARRASVDKKSGGIKSSVLENQDGQ